MNMKDRVDNFLKIAEERMNNDVHNRELQSQLVDLCGELTGLIEDPDEQNRLHDGFNKSQVKTRIAAWDERFLNVIAGEGTQSDIKPVQIIYPYHQVTGGKMKQRVSESDTLGTNIPTLKLRAPSGYYEDPTLKLRDPNGYYEDKE